MPASCPPRRHKSASVPSSRTAIPIEPLPPGVGGVRRASLHLAAGPAEDEGLSGPQPGGIEGAVVPPGAPTSARWPSKATAAPNQSPAAVARTAGPALRPLAGTPAPGEDDDRSTLPVASPGRPRAAHLHGARPLRRSPSVPPFAVSRAARSAPIRTALEHVDRSTAGRSRRTDDEGSSPRRARSRTRPPPCRPSRPASLSAAGPIAAEDMDRAGVDRGHREAHQDSRAPDEHLVAEYQRGAAEPDDAERVG